MKQLKNLMPIVIGALLAGFASCSDKTTSKEERVEITSMDSTARKAKEAREKLEEQTKKVETSIEKLDEEFKNNQ